MSSPDAIESVFVVSDTIPVTPPPIDTNIFPFAPFFLTRTGVVPEKLLDVTLTYKSDRDAIVLILAFVSFSVTAVRILPPIVM